MPSFLDYLFSYGDQEFDQDFHFSGLHFEPRLHEASPIMRINELCRSGKVFELCYSLRSVEEAKRQTSWPWSVRGTAVYHSFDTGTAHANWITVKGSTLMKERFSRELDPENTGSTYSLATDEGAFAYSLATHLLLCNWSGENWRWYINFMEAEVQKITRRTLILDVSSKPSSSYTANVKSGSEKPKVPNGFSFDDLQRIQYIEEKANETRLVLSLNINVLTALRRSYENVLQSSDFPKTLRKGCRTQIANFFTVINNTINDLDVQKSRVETLIRLLGDRKTLVSTHNRMPTKH